LDEEKATLLILESGGKVLLEDREVTWRLKSIALWLKCGDENIKKFQAYAKGWKDCNNIWSLRNTKDEEVHSFNDLATLGKNHFNNLFKA